MFAALACMPERNDPRNYMGNTKTNEKEPQQQQQRPREQKACERGEEGSEKVESEKASLEGDESAKKETISAPQVLIQRSGCPRICHETADVLANVLVQVSVSTWTTLCNARLRFCGFMLGVAVSCLSKKNMKSIYKEGNWNTVTDENSAGDYTEEDEEQGTNGREKTCCFPCAGSREEEEEEDNETEEEIAYRTMVPQRRTRTLFLGYAVLLTAASLVLVVAPEQALGALGWLHARDMLARWLGLMFLVHVWMCVMAASNKPPNFYVSSAGFAGMTCVLSAIACVMLCAVSTTAAGALAIFVAMLFMMLSVAWAMVWGQVYSNASHHADSLKV